MIQTNEILVFLSYANPDPVALAEQLLQELELPYIAVGVDALTGSAEIRLNYLEDTHYRIEEWLKEKGVDYEIEVL
jgi:seryl-tRNA synthetase